jgi:lipopolysaccharide biosynthesis protein
MLITKKSLCIFTHFSDLPHIPYYVRVYVNELSNYFDEVIVAANQRNFTNQQCSFNNNVTIQFLENEGYDLGKFYKVFQTIQPSAYFQIACVNDSNILFNKLDSIFEWGKKSQSDFWGLIDSNEKPWFSTHPENYHIQSHFIVFNESAIKCLFSFFENIDIQHILNEKDLKKLRQLVIDQWEIGLSQFLFSKDFKSDSYINSRSFLTKHKSKDKNITHSHYKELIKEGYPLIKKKVVLKKSWRSVLGKKECWENLLAEYGYSDWDISLLIDENKR